MALSLLQGYDSDQGSSSDSEDDIQVTIDKEALKKQEIMQQTTGPTTTNLTLNMNFNMQQSSI